ncbi:MAG TPA: flagellar basal-body MS-ring/collar protein FliF [Candidatus Limnocylindria bacterium]|jgi:flagellar M-ring protein FliF|nr:flagellar basal-body MS-ring/collar protein FliF [Candidatus Limnocylindria bacterium]
MNQSFTQIVQQLKAIWKELGINQKVSIVVATVAVLAGLGGVAAWSGRTEYVPLYSKLDEGEASKVLAVLDDAKIPYKVEKGSGTIFVPADKKPLMLIQLAGKGLPKGGEIGMEIFDKPNFGLSDFIQRANYIRAIQGELARTIGQIDGIEGARVMVTMPPNRLLVDYQSKPTASVFVRVRGNIVLPQTTVNAVRYLVANSVEGLVANNVTVADNLGNTLSEHSDSESIGGLTATQLAARKSYELYLTRKAQDMLEAVIGPGQAIVRVAVDVDQTTLHREEKKFDPDGQVLRTGTITDENTDSQSIGQTPGGTPGVPTNANTETNSATGNAQTTKSVTKKKESKQQYEINEITSTMTQGAGGVRRISAAVFVATKMTGPSTNRVAQPRTPEEIAKIKKAVQSALGIQEVGGEGGRKDELTVEEMAFNDEPQQQLATQLEQGERRRFWSDILKNAMYPALGLCVVAAFWRVFQKTPLEQIPIGVPVGDGQMNGMAPNGMRNGNGHRNGNGNGNNHGLDGESESEKYVMTVDIMNELVKQNPQNVTQALRNWMVRGTRPMSK